MRNDAVTGLRISVAADALVDRDVERLTIERDAAVEERDTTNTDLNDRIAELLAEVEQATARAVKAETECARLERIARNANSNADMYANAWQRELGQVGFRKRHHIDALVEATQRLRHLANVPPLDKMVDGDLYNERFFRPRSGFALIDDARRPHGL